MADVLSPHCISTSKSMEELEAILSDNDNNHRYADDAPHEEGEEQEHEEFPPPIRTVETNDSGFEPHLGDLELHSVNSYPEVLYEKSTPLFTAIEHTKWREAYQLAKEFPQQIATWVVSQNTELPTLGWSLWRRLPIHEACRRQAPAWLVAQLISAFPESVQCTTQFGEYPLHLAVECAATPEVVHVLVVAHWPAVVARDNGGRTPLEILEETELMQSPSGDSEEGARFSDISEAKIIYQSLQRSQQTYLKLLEEHDTQKSDLELEHEQHVVKLKQGHDEQLVQERGRHKTLEEKVERLNGVIMELQHNVAKKESKLLALKNLEHIYQDRVEEQKGTVEALRFQLQQKDTVIEQLQKALQEKEAHILRERERADGLSHDVWHMTRLHDTQLQDVLQQAENALQNLVHCQLAVHGQWLGQHRALHHILQQRGIPEPTPNAPTTSSETAAAIAAATAAVTLKPGKSKDEEREIMEEKKNEEEPMDANAAAQVAAAAAMHALQSADQRGVDEATAPAEDREQPTDSAAVAGATAAAVAIIARELQVDPVVPSDEEKVKPPAKAGKGDGALLPSVGNDGEEEEEDDDEDSDEEEDGEEDFDSDDDDDDDEEYDSQEETDEDSGSDDDTSDDDDEEFSGDEGEHAEEESTHPTTDAWKKQ